MIYRASICAAAATIFLLMANAAAAAPLTVTVTDVANNKGSVLVSICDRNTFLKRCNYRAAKPAKRGGVVVEFDVPAGQYAVSAFHDENGDKKLNRSSIGIPAEGCGYSREPAMRTGPPKFADAAIDVGPSGAKAAVKLIYY